MELTHRFADFLVNINYESLPAAVTVSAKERLLDTIAAMISGRTGWAYSEALLEAVKPLGGGDSTPIGPDAPACYPAARSAMLNATFAHAIELDDGHKFAGVHAGAVVVPTALNIGVDLGVCGKDILAAIVVGYEIIYRLAVAQGPELIERGFHPSAICDTIGAMAVAGKLMKLNKEQLANGLGLAGLQAAGLMESTVSGQQSKCVMVGNAAFNGISCAYVAARGLEGSTTVFEGKTGLFQAMSKPVRAETICDGLGEKYLISETYNKFYPTCRHVQPAIEAVINLAATHDLNPAEVDYVEIGTHHVAYDLTGHISSPQNPGEAKFSIPYGVAVAIVDRGFAVRHLNKGAYTDEKYLNISRRVSVRVDEKVEALYPKRRGAWVKICMKDGMALTDECYDLKGSPNNPVGYEELVRKFRTIAESVISPSKTDEMIVRCSAFEDEWRIDDFMGILNW
jgi:2-methylcitrate dehydratase PrpD